MVSIKSIKCKLTSHQWGEWEYELEGSCQKAKVCNYCGEKMVGEEEHRWGEGEYEHDGSCMQATICGRCGQKKTGPEVHQWGKRKYNAEIDTQEQTCRRCKKLNSRKRPDDPKKWAEWLEHKKDPRAIPLLIASLEDPVFEVRLAAQDVLVQIGEPAVEPLLEEARQGKKGVAAALGHIGGLKAVPILVHMIATDERRWHDDSVSAALALGSIGEKLWQGLEKNPEAISELPSFLFTVIPPLIEALQDKDWGGRWAAAEALGEMRTDTIVGPLIEVLQDKEWKRSFFDGTWDYWATSLRQHAAQALGELNASDAMPLMGQIVKDPTDDPEVRKKVIQVLQDMLIQKGEYQKAMDLLH